MKKKLSLLFLFSGIFGVATYLVGLSAYQSVIVFIFTTSIMGTLFFWDFRLSFVFVGSGIMFLLNAVTMEEFIRFASLDVILFLISMMIIVAMMKEAGFFYWLITRFLRFHNLSGGKLFTILMFTSAALSGLMGEVTSIIVMATVILNISDFLEIDPKPLIISSVMATNIGSASTVLGNPVGVLIAARSQLSFEDFITHAALLCVVILIMTTLVLYFLFRKYLQDVGQKLHVFQDNASFLYLISVPSDRKARISIIIFGVTIVLIAMHKRLEMLLGLEHNVLLIMIPVISAGIVMFYRHDKARQYIEKEVEWPSLLFFMFLFAQAGVMRSSGIAGVLAQKLLSWAGSSTDVLSGIILFSSGFLSGGLDNVVTVASYIPIILSLDLAPMDLKHLWWPLLFGACFGGNLTMIGSTANIVALGLLEKERDIRIGFLEWLKVGLTVGLLSMIIAYLAILYIPIY